MATQAEDVQIEEEGGTSTTWLLIYTGIVLLVVHQVYTVTYFWRKGIPGPFALPLLGNFISFSWGMIPAYESWAHKYGDYFGIFFGTSPALVIADPDLAKHVLVKDFPSFQSRNLKSFSIPYLADSIIEASGEVWKRGRSYISPTFSGSKMKKMFPDMNAKCDILIEVLNEKTKGSKSVDIREVIGPYVIDNVACCAYGLESDCQRDPNDNFLVQSKKMMEFSFFSPGVLLRAIFPFLGPYLDKVQFFDILPAESVEFFADCVRKAIELRKESDQPQGKKDFLQLMLDAAEGGGDGSAPGETNGQVESTGPKKKIPLTQKELIGQSLLFFFAGYDTVSTTTSYAAYAIARFPEVQKKLQEEIDEITSEGEVSYESISKMEYLDKVWCESQRLWPIGFLLERVCNQAFTYNGKTIPEGQYMNISVWNIHHNPKYWSDPQTFNPENFSKEAKESRHPCAFMPFGNGPRVCVAQRFALLEGKLVLARLVQKYNLKLDPKTPDLDDMTNLGNASTLYPPKGIHIQFEERDQ